MAENQVVAGEHWTTGAIRLLSDSGWHQRGTARFDIPCNMARHRSRANTAKVHGLDAVFSYVNPFLGSNVGVIVETKHYAWGNITPARISEWVDQVTAAIECCPLSGEFGENFNPDSIQFQTGLLLVWCNTPEQYSRDAFMDKVRAATIPSKRASLRLLVASNEDILRLASTNECVRQLRQTATGFYYLYPSVENSPLKRDASLSLEFMFSSYIYAKHQYMTAGRGGQVERIASLVFMNEPATLESLNFAYMAAKRFQLEECDDLIFYLYEPWDAHRAQVDEFKRSANAALELTASHYRIDVKYVTPLAFVPEQ